MYLIVIAWLYVVLMMSVAEATNSNGTVLGAIITFLMYGVGPAALVAYLMGTPARNRRVRKQQAEEIAQARQQAQAQPQSQSQPEPAQPAADWQKTGLNPPDAGRHAAGGAEAIAAEGSRVTPVRKEP
jgi:hypothetical protein